jgi:hypothetical protein
VEWNPFKLELGKMLTRDDLGVETDRRIARALSRWTGPSREASEMFSPDHASAADLRLLLERDGRSGTTRRVRLDGRTAYVYLGFARGGEPFVHGVGESPELAVLEAFLNLDAIGPH